MAAGQRAQSARVRVQQPALVRVQQPALEPRPSRRVVRERRGATTRARQSLPRARGPRRPAPDRSARTSRMSTRHSGRLHATTRIGRTRLATALVVCRSDTASWRNRRVASREFRRSTYRPQAGARVVSVRWGRHQRRKGSTTMSGHNGHKDVNHEALSRSAQGGRSDKSQSQRSQGGREPRTAAAHGAKLAMHAASESRALLSAVASAMGNCGPKQPEASTVRGEAESEVLGASLPRCVLLELAPEASYLAQP